MLTEAPERGQDLLRQIFLPFQRRWLADPARVKVAEKSRQIGWSWTEAFDSAQLASVIDGGMDSWIIHLNEDSAREWINDVAFWARFLNAAASEVQEVALEKESKDLKAFMIQFASGYRVTALSSRPSNLRGKRGKVVIEEAAFHDSLDELLKACKAFLMWGGKISLISTHDGDGSEYNQLINRIRAGKQPGWSLHRTTFDEAVAQGLYEKVAMRLNLELSPEAEAEWVAQMYADYGEHADEELRCIPRQGGEIYISRVLAERCMDKQAGTVVWFEYNNSHTAMSKERRLKDAEERCNRLLNRVINGIPATAKTYLGQDFARSTNLSCIAVKAMDNNLHGWIPLLLKMKNCPFDDQDFITHWIIQRLKRRTRFSSGALDASGNGAQHAETTHNAFPEVEQTLPTQDWHRNAWARYKRQLEDQTLTLPLDGDLLDSHALVVKENGIPHIPRSREIKDSRGNKAHADDLFAICLAEYASWSLPDSGAYIAAFC